MDREVERATVHRVAELNTTEATYNAHKHQAGDLVFK